MGIDRARSVRTGRLAMGVGPAVVAAFVLAAAPAGSAAGLPEGSDQTKVPQANTQVLDQGEHRVSPPPPGEDGGSSPDADSGGGGTTSGDSGGTTSTSTTSTKSSTSTTSSTSETGSTTTTSSSGSEASGDTTSSADDGSSGAEESAEQGASEEDAPLYRASGTSGADVVARLGAPWPVTTPEREEGSARLPSDACLLYTSPSPRD